MIYFFIFFNSFGKYLVFLHKKSPAFSFIFIPKHEVFDLLYERFLNQHINVGVEVKRAKKFYLQGPKPNPLTVK